MKKVNFFKKVCTAFLAIALVVTSVDMGNMDVQAATKKVTLSTTKQTINSGASFTLSVKGVKGLKSDKVIFSSDNAKVAKVSTSKATTTCTVKGISGGKVTITAKSKENSKVTAKCTVTVNQLATSVKLNHSKYTLDTGKNKTVTLKATVNPSKTKNKAVTWSSSNTSIAKVSSKGKVTAVSAGKVTITATAKDGSKKSAKCAITVNQAATSVVLNQTQYVLAYKGKVSLTATVLPTNTKNKKVTWKSSNSSIATVDSKGRVTAKSKTGTATITATTTDGTKKSASCKITVKDKKKITKSSSVTVTPATAALNVGQSTKAYAAVAPSNATLKTVFWASSNTAVATVDQKGNIKAIGAGTATITAKAQDGSKKSGSCVVTVKQPVAGIAMSKATLRLEEGKTATLTATVTPANATNPAVTWSSSNTAVATVANGVVTAVAAGTATITATADGKTATCVVTVIASVTGITLSSTDATINQGEVRTDHSFTLTATVAPATAADKTVTWTSDSSVITVNNGAVTIPANTPPTTTAIITATTANGISASITVYVTGQTNVMSETADTYVFNVDKNASEYKAATATETKTVAKDDMIAMFDHYADRVDNKLNAGTTQSSKLESLWNGITVENFEKLEQNTVTATVTEGTTGSERYKQVTLTGAGKTKSFTVFAPLSFTDSATGNYVKITNAIVTDSSAIPAGQVTIEVSNIAISADSVNNIATFAVKVTNANGDVVTDKLFKAVAAIDTKSAKLYRVEGSDVLVADYAETANAYTLTVEKSFYQTVVTTLDTSRTITDVTLFNVYK